MFVLTRAITKCVHGFVLFFILGLGLYMGMPCWLYFFVRLFWKTPRAARHCHARRRQCPHSRTRRKATSHCMACSRFSSLAKSFVRVEYCCLAFRYWYTHHNQHITQQNLHNMLKQTVKTLKRMYQQKFPTAPAPPLDRSPQIGSTLMF